MCCRIIIAWGNGSKNNPGNRSSPSSSIYRYLKRMSQQLGRFAENHTHAGQQRLIVLKVNENYSSRTPSCWALGEAARRHPPVPNQVPQRADHMQHVDGKWSVLKCPHCQKTWQRDVNAIRYFNSTLIDSCIEILHSYSIRCEKDLEDQQFLDRRMMMMEISLMEIYLCSSNNKTTTYKGLSGLGHLACHPNDLLACR